MKKYVANVLMRYLEMSEEEILSLLETPPNRSMGDVAFPCFTLAKTYKKAPNLIANELAESVNDELVEAKAIGPYLNFYFRRDRYAANLVKKILEKAGKYGENDLGNNKTIVVDFSSPNIAKPFSLPHLRSTMIGNAIVNLHKALGYDVVGINHLGDWGTQFGKEIVAYKKWGNDEEIKKNPIKELVRIYVKFHEEAEKHPELEDEARVWFKKLEDGDEEAVRLWKWFVDESIKEFEKIYQLLGVKFDHYMGESFYNDKMERVVKELTEKGLLKESEGALVVDLSDLDMPPAIIKKKDGSSIYATRDLAAALYRKDRFDFEKMFYVVGNEQKLHFEQVFAVLKKMDYDWAEQMVHVPFGLMLFENKKMSTRKGTIVLLEEVLQKSIEMADRIIEEKNPNLENRKEVAEAIGVGAVIFNDLKNHRMHEVNFSWEEALNFEGETGPYVQYTNARTQSLIRKSTLTTEKLTEFDGQFIAGDTAWELIHMLGQYPDVLLKAADRAEPSVVARYLLDISAQFNRFYHQERIITENIDEQKAKLALSLATSYVLQHGLGILGINAPEAI
ncbi:arginine--tRNA ligase [Vulcanibacillus modesticaldus]|uniref:Arginine--tRNA ligase n=1 Tax=Vulcanibacillus modesticaldus TaxID=337097 RepID=A0A1D2YUJ5_9BACI|nr:arginine--tRNA ligase [Vulcanibacillus modesticaldus]OEF99382.1 arginine--tRNA ligase [Vulcanibacillus modesticaldus]